MTTLTTTQFTDYTLSANSNLVNGQNITLLRFFAFGQTGSITAIFNAAQFGSGNISNTVQVDGRPSPAADVILVRGIEGSFSAAGWTFLSWATGPVFETTSQVVLSGVGTNDLIIGSDVADRIVGNQGDDTMQGRGGVDWLDGGQGDDVFRYFAQGEVGVGETVAGNEGIDTIERMNGGDLDIRALSMNFVERLSIQNGTFTVRGDQIGGDPSKIMMISGSGGVEGLTVIVDTGSRFAGLDQVTFTNWTSGVDLIRVFGTSGDDVIIGSSQFDQLFGDAGNDLILGQAGNDLAYGWLGADTLLGDAGADTLLGEQDNDVLYGWTGADVLWGGGGDDVLWGEQDNDTLLGETGDDVLLGVDGDDVMYGWVGNDTLYGWFGNDVLWGEAGNDLMLGEAGNDTFIGGLGRDTMTGGQGADRFFNANFEIAAGELDLITDYDAADRYLFQSGAQIQYFNFNAPGYGVGAGIHVTVAGGVFILDVFGATATQLQAQTQFF